MRKIFVLTALILIVSAMSVFAQTWTVEGGNDWEFEYTVISRENFNRIKKANEVVSQSAMLHFSDISEMNNQKIVYGNKPEIKGYYFLSIRRIPKNEISKNIINYFRSTIAYGNSETGAMSITFLNIGFLPSTISLKYNIDEYYDKVDELIQLVNNE